MKMPGMVGDKQLSLGALGHTGIDGHGVQSNMLMQGHTGQMMSAGMMASAQTKMHSAEKDPHSHRAGMPSEFTATKYGGERSAINSYENEKTLSDKLEVTVIPVDEEPYSKMITIP